jgi:hypothetical protein
MLLASTACGPAGRSGGSDPFSGGSGASAERSEGGRIEIRVRNSNFNEATIYAVRAGSRRRLGRVQGANDQVFRMPWATSNQLQFEVDILGGQDCRTRFVMVDPGQTVMLNIESMSRARADGSYGLCEIRRGR